MYLHCCAVEAQDFHLDPNNALDLQHLEKVLQHSVLAPAVHPHIYRVPVTVGFRQCPPFAAVFRDIQYCVHQLMIAHADVSTLAWQVWGYPFKLLLRYFHTLSIP